MHYLCCLGNLYIKGEINNNNNNNENWIFQISCATLSFFQLQLLSGLTVA